MNSCDVCLSMTVVILTLSVLIWSLKELMIGSIILYKFFLSPFLHNNNEQLWTNNTHSDYVYILTFFAILFSIIGSLCIYQTLICSAYFDGCKIFQIAFIISISFSISILLLNYTVGYDTYEYYIERDMYVKVSSMGDYQCDRYNCYKTQVYFMHQEHKCCGWHTPTELTFYDGDKLPLFCCARVPNVFPQCTLNSTNLFTRTCRKYGSEFWRISNVDPSVVNPTTFFSLFIKFLLVYGYAIGRREMLLPTSDSRFVDTTSIGRI